MCPALPPAWRTFARLTVAFSMRGHAAYVDHRGSLQPNVNAPRRAIAARNVPIVATMPFSWRFSNKSSLYALAAHLLTRAPKGVIMDLLNAFNKAAPL